MPFDRTLAITATPTLIWRGDGGIGATMAYQQTSSVPDMPGAVDPQSGSINLENMPTNSRYTDNIDILITLDASATVDQNGNPLEVRWATLTESTPPSVGCCWFCTTPASGQNKDSTPITIPGMTTGRISDTMVFIDDNTSDGSVVYTFCLAIVIPSRGNYYITIDPNIVGKGVGNR
jgi:hypothetical protein